MFGTPKKKIQDPPLVVHTSEFLNTINASGLLHHKIRLKIGVPIMVLRNIDLKLGLRNGTRLIITRMRKFVLEGNVISGSNIGGFSYQVISFTI